MGWTNAGRKKAAQHRRGKHLSSKTRSKIAARLKGRHHKVSASARKHMSQVRKGKKHPHKGHAISAATRKKMSAKLKGRPGQHHKMSAASRAKLSKALKGRKHPHKGAHVKHHVTHVTRRHRVAASHRLRKTHRLTHGHVQGMSNLKVIARLSKHRVKTTANKQSNQSVLQLRVRRPIATLRRGRTNKRIILNVNSRRRKP